MTKIVTTTYNTITVASDESSGGDLNTSIVGGNLIQLAKPVQSSWIRVNTDGTVASRTVSETRSDLSLGTAATKDVVANSEDTLSTAIPDINWINVNVGKVADIGKVFVDDFYTVSSKEDFPEAVAGVITLTGGAWMLTTDIDLQGDRIVCTGNVVIKGTSSETASLTSTGLPATQSLITSNYNIPLQDISISVPNGTQAINLIADTGFEALDWRAVNFVNCANIGTIDGYANVIIKDSALFNSGDLKFDGTIATIALEGTLFIPQGVGVRILPTATITRRFRTIYSAFNVSSGSTGISVSVDADIPSEGYILDTVNFSGDGTYLAGVQFDDNKSQFTDCKGVNNSATLAYAGFTNNTSPTVISTTNTPVEVVGNYVLEDISQRFLGNGINRLIYKGTRIQLFEVSVVMSVESANNNQIGSYIALNDVEIEQSEMYVTTNGTGEAENITLQAVVLLQEDDELSLYVENNTSTADITATQSTVIVKPI